VAEVMQHLPTKDLVTLVPNVCDTLSQRDLFVHRNGCIA